MSSIQYQQQQTPFNHNQPYDAMNPTAYQQQHLMTMQQAQFERIRQVQQQAALQQQRALFHQQMMYYQQQQQCSPNQLEFNGVVGDSFDLMTAADQVYSSDMSSPTSAHLNKEIMAVSNSKAQRRAEHNAIERARRECLNTKFQQLAHSLPNLQNDRRPSKGTIIERTLEYVKQTVQKEERFKSEIDQLRQANEELISQMTSEQDDEYLESIEEYEESTPGCDDNFSSRSSVTSVSSNQLYLSDQHCDAQDYFMNKAL
ncbi:hypothetical protein CU098_003878 [Rhizopus stolonifer]|uniref:BHLH domain-containing protein n=1 Tax=Rhizopus stolonifer TaxID=4846 RepID=A0A367IRV0_RHIST|nr:hypothetical protein CU098_003878 [Rhizopus stolonifer]